MDESDVYVARAKKNVEEKRGGMATIGKTRCELRKRRSGKEKARNRVCPQLGGKERLEKKSVMGRENVSRWAMSRTNDTRNYVVLVAS